MRKVFPKVVIAGPIFSGKTSIINRWMNQSFNENTESTVGALFHELSRNVNGKEVKMNIWDTAGDPKYAKTMPAFTRDSSYVVIVFDLNSLSVKEGNAIIDEINSFFDEFCSDIPPEAEIAFVLNKKDLIEDDYKIEVIKETLEKEFNDYKFWLASAKTGEGLEELISTIAATVEPKNVESIQECEEKRCC